MFIIAVFFGKQNNCYVFNIHDEAFIGMFLIHKYAINTWLLPLLENI